MSGYFSCRLQEQQYGETAKCDHHSTMKALAVGRKRLWRFSKSRQPRSRFPLAQAPEGHDGRQVPGQRAGFALLPVVYGLSGSAHQKPTVLCRQRKPLPLGSQALRTETDPLRRHLARHGRRSSRTGLAQAAQFLFQRLCTPLERGNLCSAGSRRLLQSQGFAAHFFSSDAGNLALEDGCNVRHGCDCAAKLG